MASPVPGAPRQPASRTDRTEQVLKALLEILPDAILVIDKAGTILNAGAAVAAMFGYKVDEVVGRNVSMLMPSPHREGHESYVRRYLETGEAHVVGKARMVDACRRDGSMFPIHLRVAEVSDNGDPVFIGLVHDISSEVRARSRERELRFAMQHMSRISSMGELATGLAHEVNQPLTAISQYLSSLKHLIEASPRDERTIPELVEKAAAQAEHAAEIIRSLRRFVSPERGDRRRCDIAQIVDETIHLSLLDAEHERIALSIAIEPNLPSVLAESVQIQQVIHNLLRNAVEAVEFVEGAWVGVSAMLNDGAFVKVIVEDNGPGIAPHIKDSLFERFVSGRANGVGIGLAICRSIVVAHGGRMLAEDRPGGGARMSFTLPVAP